MSEPLTDEELEDIIQTISIAGVLGQYRAKRLVVDLRACRAENKELCASRDKLELAFEYADREARLAIERVKELEKKD